MKNLEDYKSIGTYWIALYVNGNNRRGSSNAIYFDSYGVELKLSWNKNKN